MLDSLITSKTRIKLLLKFFSNPKNSAYLRSLATEFGESTNSIRLELNRLSEAGLLNVEDSGNKVRYKANEKHPLFPEIKSIVGKYLGLDQIVEKVLNHLGSIEKAYVIGDYARGKSDGILEVLIIGTPDRAYLDKLVVKAQLALNKQIYITVVDPRDQSNQFIKSKSKVSILIWEE